MADAGNGDCVRHVLCWYRVLDVLEDSWSDLDSPGTHTRSG